MNIVRIENRYRINERGEACAGSGRDRERCICIMTPSGCRTGCNLELSSPEMPVQAANKQDSCAMVTMEISRGC